MKDFDTGFSLAEIAEMENIAENVDKEVLDRIGRHCKEGLEIDEGSCDEWNERHDKAMDLAMQVSEYKDWPWEGASNIIYPMITTGAIQFAARALPVILQGKRIVKCEILGDDEGIFEVVGQNPDGTPQVEERVPVGFKAGKAERVSQHMSYQLNHEIRNWKRDMDAMLHYLAIAGCAFKKTTFSPEMNRVVSRWIPANQLCVNMAAEDFETAPRISECFQKYPYEIEEMIRRGDYIVDEDDDIRSVLRDPDAEREDEEAAIELVEQRVRLDLDGDGYPEPYIVIFHRHTGYVLAIYNNFQEVEGSLDDVIAIKADIPYTKYDFLPNPANGFYGIGLGWLLGPLNEQVNTTINQLNDAGTLQNMPGGFMARGLRIKGGDHTFQPGEFKQVDSSGASIRENLYQFQFPGPSPVLFQLLGLMIDASQDISSTKDIMMGDTNSQMQPQAIQQLVEQGSKQFNSIFLRVHECMGDELRRLFLVNGRTLTPDKYFRFMDIEQKVQIDDYDAESLDVMPASNPNMVTDQQKMAQVQGILQGQQIFGPMQNPQETMKRYYEALNIEDPQSLIAPPPPPPQPELSEQAKMISAQAAMMRAQNDQAKSMPEILKIFADITEVYSKALLNTEKAESESDGVQYAQQLATLAKQLRDLQNGPEDIQRLAGGPGNGMGSGVFPAPPGLPMGGNGNGNTF